MLYNEKMSLKKNMKHPIKLRYDIWISVLINDIFQIQTFCLSLSSNYLINFYLTLLSMRLGVLCLINLLINI